MRLINAEQLVTEEKFSFEVFDNRPVPPFAILSHCWEDEEVTFGDCKSGGVKSKKGYAKIWQTCRQAALVLSTPVVSLEARS